jgi:hypothetical protein
MKSAAAASKRRKQKASPQKDASLSKVMRKLRRHAPPLWHAYVMIPGLQHRNCLAEAPGRSVASVCLDTAGIVVRVAAKQCIQRFACFGASVR